MDKIELPEKIILPEWDAEKLLSLWQKSFNPHIIAATGRLKSKENWPRIRKLPWPNLAKYNEVADSILLGEKAFCLALKLAPEQVVRGLNMASSFWRVEIPHGRDFIGRIPEEKKLELLKICRTLMTLRDDAKPAYIALHETWPPVFARYDEPYRCGWKKV